MKSSHIDEYVSSGTSPTIRPKVSKKNEIVAFMTAPTLSPIQAYALRLTLFGGGKTIFHRRRLCEVVESHQSIHLLFPLINADLTMANPMTFWVPYRPVSRSRFKRERT